MQNDRLRIKGGNQEQGHNRSPSKMDRPEIVWDYAEPFCIQFTICETDVDAMGHTNNVIYLRWLEQVSWAHSRQLGLIWADYERLQRAMVVRRHELDYLAASFSGETVVVATWISSNDGRLRVERRYQVVRAQDGKTLLRGRSIWVCIDLASGRPRRMPAEFTQRYAVSRAFAADAIVS
jgi:acyl-CoA thioester hydrolase